MASQADLEPARKRQRKAKSCQPCRDRKVRCDQASPCGPCQRSRDHLKCTYRDLPPSLDGFADGSSHSVGVATGAQSSLRPEPARAAALPGNVYHTAQSPGGWTTLNAPHSANPASNGVAPAYAGAHVAVRPHGGAVPMIQDAKIKELEERVRLLEEDRVRRLENEHVRPSGEESASHSRQLQPRMSDDQAAGEDAAKDKTRINAIPPRLRITTEKVKLFGPSHWVHTTEKVILQTQYCFLTLQLTSFSGIQIRFFRYRGRAGLGLRQERMVANLRRPSQNSSCCEAAAAAYQRRNTLASTADPQ